MFLGKVGHKISLHPSHAPIGDISVGIIVITYMYDTLKVKVAVQMTLVILTSV